MALELNKLTGQVAAMGQAVAARADKLSGRADQARELLAAQPEVSEELKRKIDAARRIDEWRRGCLPLGERLNEHCRPLVQPRVFTLIAADGSQIYPDRHGIAAYYLLNTGSIVLRAGTGEAPATDSIPEIFFEDADLYDEDGRMRSAEFIGAQRNRRELSALADLAEVERTAPGSDLAVPIVCLIDGPLLPWIRTDPDRPETLNEELAFFTAQMDRLRAADAIPVGYVDRPGSAYVLRVLELIGLPIAQITARRCAKALSFNSPTGNCLPIWLRASGPACSSRFPIRTIVTALAPATASPLRTPISPANRVGQTPPSRASKCPAGSHPTQPSWIWPRPPSLPTASRQVIPTSLLAPMNSRSSAALRRKAWSRCCSRPCCAAGSCRKSRSRRPTSCSPVVDDDRS